MNYYETLGVDKGADDAAITKAYRKLARKYHPDVSKEPDATERFQAIQKAYAVLSDPVKRQHYDETGNAEMTIDPKDLLAQRSICHMFLSYLEKGNEENPLTRMRQVIANAIGEDERAIIGKREFIKRIEGKRKNVRRVTDGRDLYAGVVDETVRVAIGQIESLEGNIDVSERMLKMLDEYESLVVDPSHYDPLKMYGAKISTNESALLRMLGSLGA